MARKVYTWRDESNVLEFHPGAFQLTEQAWEEDRQARRVSTVLHLVAGFSTGVLIGWFWFA